MALKDWLDWLQRGQAAWAAVKAIPLVTGAVGAYLAGLAHLQPWAVFLIALWALVGGLALVNQMRAASTSVSSAPATEQWLIDIARSHLQDDAASVIAYRAEVEWQLDGVAPHAVITFLVWNLSVWPIVIVPALTGRISLAGLELPDPPEFREPPSQMIPHARGVPVRLRQSITGRTLFHVREQAPQGAVQIAFDKLFIYARFGPPGAEAQKRVELMSTGLVSLPDVDPVR